MKKLFVLTAAALFVIMVGSAQAYIDPADIHINDGTTYLFNGEVHDLTNPSTASLQGSHHGVTIADLFVVFAVPGDTNTLATDVNGIFGSQAGLLNGGNLTSGMEVYGDIIGLSPANNSESFVNFTKNGNEPGVTNFDIWQFLLSGANLSQSNDVTLNFSFGVPDGTYVFAYGFGSDDKLYVTPFTETGLQGPPHVPEPSMLLLFGSGLLGLGFFAGKKKL